MQIILLYILAAFIGYVIGRIGHVYIQPLLGNPKNPHHWIYGFILMILGLIYYKNFWWQLIFYLGLGHFISDLNDFLHFKILGPDKEGKKRFWHID